MEVFLGILGVIWGVLCIVLFFKVWGMCNNVDRILRIMEKENNKEDDKKSQLNIKASHNKSLSQQEKSRPEVSIQTRINPWR